MPERKYSDEREREREEKFKIYLVINSVSLGGGFPMKVKVTHRF